MPLSEKWSNFMQKLGLGKRGQKNDHYYHQHESKTNDDPFGNLSEVAAPPPMQNEDENAHTYVHHTLEEER